jgi:hypothetical protein
MGSMNRVIAEGWDNRRVDHELAEILRALKREERLAGLGYPVGAFALESFPKLEIINELPDQSDGLEAA